MSPIRRRVFFWLLTLTFLATTPAIVLFLMGYRYSVARGVFVYTGSISIQANPDQNLDIRVDGKPVSAESNQINGSYHIEGIVPGKHSVSVSAPGFTTWSKEVPDKSGIATEFWNILLVRTNYPQTTIASFENGRAFFPLPQKNKIAVLSENDRETTVTLLNTSDNTREQVFGTAGFFLSKSAPEHALRWSPRDTNSFLISLISRDTQEEHIFLVRTDTHSATDIKDIVKVPRPKEVKWNPNADTLLFLSDTTLFSLPLNTPLQEAALSENIEAYDIIGNTAITLELKTGILYQIPLGNPANKEQLTTAPPEGFPSAHDTAFSLIAYDKTRIALLNHESGDLFLFNRGETGEWFKRLSQDAKGLQFSDDGKKLLYWTDWEIFAFFTRKWDVQPVRQENDSLDIGRFSNMVHGVQWTKDYEHILFSSGNDIRTIELDDRGGRDITTLLTLPDAPEQISGIGSKNEVLFLSSGTQLNRASTLSSITFPESIGFFGFGR